VIHHTVAATREDLESTGEFRQSPKRKGKDGRTTKPRQTANKKAAAEAKAVATEDKKAAVPIFCIGVIKAREGPKRATAATAPSFFPHFPGWAGAAVFFSVG
jgi:hypothetical protein